MGTILVVCELSLEWRESSTTRSPSEGVELDRLLGPELGLGPEPESSSELESSSESLSRVIADGPGGPSGPSGPDPPFGGGCGPIGDGDGDGDGGGDGGGDGDGDLSFSHSSSSSTPPSPSTKVTQSCSDGTNEAITGYIFLSCDLERSRASLGLRVELFTSIIKWKSRTGRFLS